MIDPHPSDHDRLRTRRVQQAVSQLVTYDDANHPSRYELVREILTIGLTLPQELKGLYINAVAALFQEDDEDPATYQRFEKSLQTLLAKSQGLVHAGDMLFQRRRIAAAVTQLRLFSTVQGNPRPIIDDGGIRIDPMTGEELPDEKE